MNDRWDVEVRHVPGAEMEVCGRHTPSGATGMVYEVVLHSRGQKTTLIGFPCGEAAHLAIEALQAYKEIMEAQDD